LLTVLSQAGLVSGSPGPGGGYSLARRPDQIALHDVYVLFERDDVSPLCPFGGGVCGVGDPCALHDKLVAMQSAIKGWLLETTFEIFRFAAQDKGLKPVAKDAEPPVVRMSYRAPKHKGV
jgi:Rrf2 family protein